MKLIEGGYKKGMWLHDPDAYTDEEIEYANEAFRRLAQADPCWLKLVWEPRREQPEIRRIK
ncbi:MAG: hypothetical protein JRJ75_13130 [Deltaproteobacteria bacterium]|nr:hypothetical protein [Deltaproteobacteria bacterium]MBW1930284.1 hypothetical protein [Deltaproteobacteria bacterium]